MAEDYLTDDEQLEHVKRVVAENWLWGAGGVVLGAALIFGYRYYESYVNDRALRAAAQFEALTSALALDDQGKVRQVADGLIKEYPTSPYADQAHLVLAKLSVDSGKPADAIAPLTQVMNNSKDAELKHIARLRLARVLTALGKPDDAIKTLADDAWGAFASQAHEVRGDAFYAKHDIQGAVKEYQAALGAGDAGSAGSALLQLKLADLSAPSSAALPTAAPPTADPSNKAKP